VVPALPVGTIVIYSSSPVQAIVGLAVVSEIIETTPSKLWEVARDNGGGLTRAELRTYFQSKKSGFALMLGRVRIFKNPIDPKRIFSAFTPPQSFRYLTEKEINAILKMS
jgi:predicted transcriptional regulator